MIVIYTKNKKTAQTRTRKRNIKRKKRERRGENTGTATKSTMFRVKLVKPAFIFHFLPALQTLNY
jgi:hypothetical protein